MNTSSMQQTLINLRSSEPKILASNYTISNYNIFLVHINLYCGWLKYQRYVVICDVYLNSVIRSPNEFIF